MKKINIIIFLTSFIFSSQNEFVNPVNYKLSINNQNVRSGENLTISADILIDKGYHIYSCNPDLNLSPTIFYWEDSSYFSQFGIIEEPSPQIKYDSNLKQEVGFHKGNLKLKQTLRIRDDLDPGQYIIKGEFAYQACDIKMCIPMWDEFSLDFTVEPGPSRSQFQEAIITNYESKSNTPDDLKDQINQGIVSFILFAISMGFLALLTPCVFPMIPITVSFFTKEGEKNNNSPIKAASIYALGIIVIFTGLGLILAITLGASGANQLASNPIVNLLIAFLFIYFAFSLFGHYEIEIPSVLRQFSLKQEEKGGFIGIIFMALTFTLTSFTCTVQFVGLLLVAASQGSYFWPIIGMIFFSSAFASPFFFLALFPQYLSKLPKSGGWLNSVKVTMGFLELGAAMKFISNADLVWQWHIFTKPTVLASWTIIAFMMGIYLLGKVKLPHDSDLDYIGVPRLVLSIIFLTFSLYLSTGLFGRPIHGLIDSYLPPPISENDFSLSNTTHNDEEIKWLDNLEQALIESKNSNTPIFIDFTGYTCTNCRWMETNIFEHSTVKDLFKNFIMVRLYTDGGENHRQNQQMEIDRFGTAALPFYVVLNKYDEEIARFPGMDTNPDNFINFLNDALTKHNLN